MITVNGGTQQLLVYQFSFTKYVHTHSGRTSATTWLRQAIRLTRHWRLYFSRRTLEYQPRQTRTIPLERSWIWLSVMQIKSGSLFGIFPHLLMFLSRWFSQATLYSLRSATAHSLHCFFSESRFCCKDSRLAETKDFRNKWTRWKISVWCRLQKFSIMLKT